MKIRYIKDKAERQSNLKYEEISMHFFICILAFILNFKILFWYNIRPMSRTIEYKGNFFFKFNIL